ncbi:glycoside hydrolase family 6 protein [Paenibacillaceae bacterium WGS1546]|uniref:glycoside hydrolase family 6 protein n=1 Tax=Cohnella sp. WGS1546 TaxID=3366810 RepID=UPI00372D7157
MTIAKTKQAAKLIVLLALAFNTLLMAGIRESSAAEPRVDNPFVGATAYVNPDYAALIDTSIAQISDSALIAKMQTVKSYPTAVWLDRIAAIEGGAANGGRKSLIETLDHVLEQKQGNMPITAMFVVYNLPGRDCHALASNGELPLTAAGLQTYKTQYIDPIAAAFSDPKYRDIRIVAIVEPDSLPNLVTNLSNPACAAANSTNIYRDATRYALDKLHAIPNVYNYMDIGHAGWLGWDSNLQPAIDLFTSVVNGTAAGLASVDGFITNTANTTPLAEPHLPDPYLTIGGQQIRSASYYEWNPYFGEHDFTAALYAGFVAKGWSPNIGFLIDTSRNGWGGPNRPTGASGSTVNAYVDSGRIDKRLHRGNWCNPSGAGIGEPPQAAPAGYGAHLDAFVWVKPPGESDGSSSEIPNNEGKGFDRMCDPTYIAASGKPTGALPNAPVSGHWFHNQFVQLVQNAYPVIPGGGTGPTVPAAPTGLTATAGNAQATLSWNASGGATGYNMKRATTSGGPYATIATGVTGTSYTNAGLTNGTTYYYVVSAANAAGESANSAPVSVTPSAGPTVPAAPTGLTATAGDGQATLSWNASSGATGYNVKRATTSGGPYATVASGAPGTSYTDAGLTNGVTYYYVVSASNAAGESANSAQVDVTPSGGGSPGGLVVQYKAADTNAADNQIKPHLNIKNTGASAVSLSDLKVRYYFTKEGAAAMNAWIDWAQIGGANIQVTFGSASGTGADTYAELSFTAGAGSIAANGQTGDIQLRMAKSDWSNFNEADDYSYDGTKTAYADWNKVTLYHSGALIWGIEP